MNTHIEFSHELLNVTAFVYGYMSSQLLVEVLQHLDVLQLTYIDFQIIRFFWLLLGIRILSKSNYLLGFSAKHKESKGYLQT
jgi:hypothetical protein